MIDINKLEEADVGRWVIYTDSVGKEERGRLKSWKPNVVFVVFKCNDLWVEYLNYTAQGCRLEDVHFEQEDESDKQTITIFRRWKDTKDIIALFPEIPSDLTSYDLCMSYMHIGQHSAAHIDIMEETEPVKTFYGYRDLMAELITIGYNVKPVDVLLAEYNKTRKEAIKRYSSNMREII